MSYLINEKQIGSKQFHEYVSPEGTSVNLGVYQDKAWFERNGVSYLSADDTGVSIYDNFNVEGDIIVTGSVTTSDLILTEEQWEDLRFPANVVNPGVANAPDWVLVKSGTTGIGDYGLLYCLAFNKNTEEEVYLFVQLPHSWKEGSELRPHIHWINHNDTTGNVIWAVEYSIANVGGFFPSTTTTILKIDACEANVDGTIKHQITELPPIDMTGHTISSMIMARLYRDADNVLDTADDDIGLLEFDIHYQIDGFGSDAEYIK